MASRQHTKVFVLLGILLFVGSCQSPMDLDVDRKEWYSDGALNPSRLSLYYYFGDSAFEAIVTDTSFLHQIWLERSSTPWQITIPEFNFSLGDTIHATFDYSPIVRQFSFSTTRQNVDGFYRSCVGGQSWIEGEYFDAMYQRQQFRWYTNNNDKKILLAWFQPDGQQLIKGRMVIRVANPANSLDTATFNGLFTLEF